MLLGTQHDLHDWGEARDRGVDRPEATRSSFAPASTTTILADVPWTSVLEASD
jgi:hypothetical protein